MITLKQFDGSVVTPKDDAKLYNLLINKNGIIEGCAVTHIGGNSIKVAGGRGIICGRIFVIEEETILATLSAIGSKLGRLIVKIDVSNASTPISFVTQCEAVLPALVQETINDNGNIFEFELATYNVGETAISNLVDTKSMVNGFLSSKLNADDDGKNIKVTFTEATVDADIASGESHRTLFGKIKKRFSTIATTLTNINSALNGKAPTNHAVADGTYGLGTYSAYGHIKTYQGLDFTGADAFALHANQGKVLNDKIVSFTNNFTSNRLPTRSLFASGNITVQKGTVQKLILITTLTIVEPIDVIYVETCQWGTPGSLVGGFYSFVFPFDIARYPYNTSAFGNNTHSVDPTLNINLINGCGFRRVGNTIEVYMTPFVDEYNIRTYPYNIRVYY